MCRGVLMAALALASMSAHAVIRHFDHEGLPQSSGALMAVRTLYYACRHQRSENGEKGGLLVLDSPKGQCSLLHGM
jgi:hypothetical protein